MGPAPSTQRATIAGVLDPLSSSECNAHLVILIFDAILLTLFPEMAVGGASISGAVGAGEDMASQEKEEEAEEDRGFVEDNV